MLFIYLLLPGFVASQNLFQNPSFESTDNWKCIFCNGSISTESRTGSYSYHVSGRQYKYSGAAQYVTVPGGHYYYFKVWVKLLNTAIGMQHHDVNAELDILDNDGKHKYALLGTTKFVYADRWYLVGGDAFVPKTTKNVKFYLMIHETGVNYLMDDAHMDQVAPFVNDTDTRIEKLRKADLTISLSGSANPNGLQVEVKQQRGEFGFGSAVDVDLIIDPQHQLYQDFFYDLFEWGVLANAVKWPAIEHTQGQYNYDKPLKTINIMASRGILMRGHNIFWGGLKHLPRWQKTMTAAEMKPELEKHIQGMTTHFKGKFQHWDVNNENIHNHLYEDIFHDKYITQWMFNETHRLDATTACYLNDYAVVSSSAGTMSYVDQIQWYKDSGIPVGGIGIQSHFGPDVDLEINKRRLDEVAALGYPIWITELDINEPDQYKKSQKYTDLLSLYFSHPAVKGVMIWHYWDGRHWRPQAALTNGPNVTPNAAGIKIRELLKNTWRTNELHSISHDHPVNTRAFKGSYKLLVHHAGKVIHSENFTVGDTGNGLRINLSGTGSNPHVDQVLIG